MQVGLYRLYMRSIENELQWRTSTTHCWRVQRWS
jgi:hypothetical protein